MKIFRFLARFFESPSGSRHRGEMKTSTKNENQAPSNFSEMVNYHFKVHQTVLNALNPIIYKKCIFILNCVPRSLAKLYCKDFLITGCLPSLYRQGVQETMIPLLFINMRPNTVKNYTMSKYLLNSIRFALLFLSFFNGGRFCSL